MQDKIFYGHYLTFPMEILRDGVSNIRSVTRDAVAYCLFQEAYKYRDIMPPEEAAKNAQYELSLNLTDLMWSYNRGEELSKLKGPKTSITHKMLIDFYRHKKPEFEVVVFLAFAAIKSILQKQPYTKLTNEYLIGRMAGNAKPGGDLPEWLIKYSSRYQLNKIKGELQRNWGLNLYAHYTRGFWISFKNKFSMEQLVMVAEKKRKNYKEKELKAQVEEIRKNVLNELYKRSEYAKIN